MVVAGQNPAEITKFCYVIWDIFLPGMTSLFINRRETVHSYATENMFNQEV